MFQPRPFKVSSRRGHESFSDPVYIPSGDTTSPQHVFPPDDGASRYTRNASSLSDHSGVQNPWRYRRSSSSSFSVPLHSDPHWHTDQAAGQVHRGPHEYLRRQLPMRKLPLRSRKTESKPKPQWRFNVVPPSITPVPPSPRRPSATSQGPRASKISAPARESSEQRRRTPQPPSKSIYQYRSYDSFQQRDTAASIHASRTPHGHACGNCCARIVYL